MIYKVFGPPGTGKTTFLLNRIEEILASGIPPTEICYLSLTNVAIEEAVSRMTARFGRGYTRRSGLNYFSTIHAFCFGLLDFPSSSIMRREDTYAIAKTLGLETEGAYSVDNVAKLALKIKNNSPELDMEEETDIRIAKQYLSYYSKYKSEKGKIDFGDMQDMYLATKPELPSFRAVFIDEAQDLTPVQWVIVKDLISRSPLSYVAGDDDQAIYAFAGSDGRTFMELEGETVILQQSYRLPAQVHQLSQDWVKRIGYRQEKTFKSKEDLGSVDSIKGLQDLDFHKGQWLLMGRTDAQVNRLAFELEGMGVPYSLPSADEWKFRFRKESLRYKLIHDFFTVGISPKEYRTLGLQVKPELFDGTPITAQRAGCEQDWKELMNVSPAALQYFSALRTNGFQPWDRDRIKVSTFHKAKGGEAENVIVDMTFPKRSRLSDRDTEHRCYYVGITRAKKNLYLLHREGKVSYET